MTMPKRTLPWAGLAPEFEASLARNGSVAEAIQAAGLDWEVDLRPVYIEAVKEPGRLGKRVARHKAVVHRDNGLPLGVVGLRYKPIQNREMLGFVDIFRDLVAAEARPVAIGEFDQGRRVFVVLKLEDSVKPVTKGDPIDVYLVMTNSHDGSAAFRIGVLPLRLACMNQLRLLLDSHHPGFRSVRHLKNAVKEARKSADRTRAYLQRFSAVMDGLASARLSAAEFDAFRERLIPIPEDAEPRTRESRRRYRAGIREAYEDDANRPLLGTRWGDLNAVAAWEQWYKPMRAPRETERTDWLFARLIMHRGNEYVNRAYRLLTA